MGHLSLEKKISLIFFGFFLCLIILEIGIRIAGFFYLFAQEDHEQINLRQKNTYTILCIGESTTASDGKKSYPEQLQHVLNEKNLGIKFRVVNKGIPSVTTDDILSNLGSNLTKYKPDMIIAMMGINDELCFIRKKESLIFEKLKIYNLMETLCFNIVLKIKALRKEMDLKKIIRKDPSNEKAYFKLGKLYKQQRRYKQAEQIFKKLIELTPRFYRAYSELIDCYQYQDEISDAKAVFLSLVEQDAQNYWAYFALAYCMYEEGRSKECEKMLNIGEDIFENKRTKNINDCWVFAMIGDFCYILGKYNRAKENYRKALKINPRARSVYDKLQICYNTMGNYENDEFFENMVEKSPGNYEFYLMAGEYLRRRRRFNDAEKIYKKAIQNFPFNDVTYRALAICLEEQDKHELAKKNIEKANMIRLQNYNPATVRNFQKLGKIAERYGLKLVLVQYPCRSIDALKKIFEPNDLIIFVDNEMIFKSAISAEGFETYFRDNLFGDFGHCNRKGNRLLTENIANVIIKEHFSSMLKYTKH